MFKTFTLPKFMSLVFISVGLFLLCSNLFKKLTWEKATGIVKELKRKKDEKTQRYPLVEFRIASGELVQVAIKQSSNRFHYKKGEDIPIMYSKDDYRKAQINSVVWIFGFPSIFILCGVIALFIPDDIWYRT